MKLTPTDQSSENSITIPKRFHYEENRSILMSLCFPDKYRSFDATLFHFGVFLSVGNQNSTTILFYFNR